MLIYPEVGIWWSQKAAGCVNNTPTSRLNTAWDEMPNRLANWVTSSTERDRVAWNATVSRKCAAPTCVYTVCGGCERWYDLCRRSSLQLDRSSGEPSQPHFADANRHIAPA